MTHCNTQCDVHQDYFFLLKINKIKIVNLANFHFLGGFVDNTKKINYIKQATTTGGIDIEDVSNQRWRYQYFGRKR